MNYITDSRQAQALRAWLVNNDKRHAQFGITTTELCAWLDEADCGQGQVEIPAMYSVTGEPITFHVYDPRGVVYYMNPVTGSVNTLDGWFPHTPADGLVQVTLDADGNWADS